MLISNNNHPAPNSCLWLKEFVNLKLLVNKIERYKLPVENVSKYLSKLFAICILLTCPF